VEKEIARYKQYLQQRYPESSTAKHYGSDLGIFNQFVGQKSPRETTLKTIDAFVQAQSNQKLKPRTINRRLAAISSFFEFMMSEAEEDSWRNPVRWKRHSIRVGHHLPRDVSDETVEALFRVIDDERDRAIFSLMVKAGLRVGESVGLNVENLERPDQDGLARLKVRGKGAKERVVWLTLEARQQVQQWLQIRAENDSQALFVNQHGRRLSVSGIQYRLKQYCQQAGVRVSCHQLRHTFARRLAEQDMPIDSLAKLMGHNSLQTTQGYIDGADPTVRADFLEAIRNLDRFTAKNGPQPPNQAILTSFSAVVADERPDHEAVLEKLNYLGVDLPEWLWLELYRHTLRRMPGWTSHQLEKRAYHLLRALCRICRWLVQERDWAELAQLNRVDLVAYLNLRQEAGLKPSSIASELTLFRSFWRDLLEQELVFNGAILQVKSPAQAEHLPKYLTSDEYQRLEQVIRTETSPNRHRDWFNRAWFYLLAHGGLRISEALNLRLVDCDFSHGRLRIRSGKGDRDRVIPMTPKLVTLLQDYLAVRESAPTDHLLLYQRHPVNPKLVARRLRKFGQQADIEALSPHRLRHTLATLLINGGMRITSLQKFLGHQNINQTLIYARVHDETVREQFATAMAQIETILVSNWPTSVDESVENPPISTT
jgi:integrase/recombinase XerD